MKTITQIEVFSLISDINSFADRAENLINGNQANYEKQKRTITYRNQTLLEQLDNGFKRNCDAISERAQKTISEARKMLGDVEALDQRLAKVDKYYLKTKQKKEEELSGKTSDRFNSSIDYFSILEDIKTQYIAISKKYSEDILPALINGLNFLFSSKRKNDYEELIVLLNTIRNFVEEIESELPDITQESIKEQKTAYFSRRKEIQGAGQKELAALEQQYDKSLNDVAESIYSELDSILPDELVLAISNELRHYEESKNKVNTGESVSNGILFMCYVDYPVDFFVQSQIVASLIKNKCSSILVEEAIRFPITLSISDASAWIVKYQTIDQEAGRAISHAMMFGFLASCPIAHLKYGIIDPENRGTSISAYFDAKKKLPDLFGDKIYISREDIEKKMDSLSSYVEETLQDKLGTEYETIYEYSQNHPEYVVSPEFLIVYDYPKNFDEHSISVFRNILRNGSKCGIYTLVVPTISQNDTGHANDLSKGLKAIEGLATEILYHDDAFFMRGIPLVINMMPEKSEFNRFFSKYMLLYEGIKNKGIAFSPLMKELVDERNDSVIDNRISYIRDMMTEYNSRYFSVPNIDTLFPDYITLGSVLYPVDIFSESVGFDKIRKAFCESGKVTLFNQVRFPLNLDLKGSFNVLLNCPEHVAEEMRGFTHHIMWNLLSFLPVTKINFKVIDTENRNSIQPFSDLRKSLPEMFDIITSQDHVHDLLREINEKIDDFTMNKLGAKYKSILEYNQNTPKRAEAITLLLVYDFPKGLDSRSVDTLINILRNGNKCGIYAVICNDPDAPFSRYESIDDKLTQIEKYCISVDYKDGNYQLMPFGLPILIPESRNVSDISSFVKEYSEAASIIKHRGISFEDILPNTLFDKNASRVLEIPIGIGDEDAIESIVFGEGTSHHCLIGGGTGGGKSTLLHTIIMSGMLNYSPDELHLYLMDFKGGTEFKVYESQRLPHIKLLALDAMQEFGESILENLVAEMDNRSNEFKNSGGYTKLQDYIEGTGKPMPRILIIMDEFQILFNDSTNRKVAMNCANLAKRIVTEGRAYGMHLMMATQSTNIISTLTLDRGTIEQMRVRVGLKCGEADTRYLFSDLYCNDAKTKMMGPKGTAVLNEDYTETPENNDTNLKLGNIGLRVAYCNDELKEKYLKIVSERYKAIPCSTQIFEGGRTKGLLEYLAEAKVKKSDNQPVAIHMGEKIKVAPPFSILLDRKRKHNILVCGTNASMTDNIIGDYLISALLNNSTTIYYIDGDILVGEETEQSISTVLSDQTDRLQIAQSRSDIIQYVHDVFDEYQLRKRTNVKDTICIIIKNLQYIDIIKAMFKGERVDENEYLLNQEEGVLASEEESVEEVPESDPMDIFAEFNKTVASRRAKMETKTTQKKRNAEGYSNEKILKLIEDGSGFGIHFMVASSDYQTVKETMRFGENVLSRFPERFVFSLSNNDADNLVEGVSVASLNYNIVYYTDGVKDTFQLKPYIAPTVDELRAFWETVV